MLRLLAHKLTKKSLEKAEPSRFLRTFYVITFPIIAVAAIATEFYTVNLFVRANRIKSWPTSTGVVTTSKLSSKFVGVTEYSADIEYLFEVDGRKYSSDSIRVRGDTNRHRWDVNALVRRYPVGKTVVVHYSPGDPTVSYLEAGPDFGNYVALVAPLFFALAFGYAFVAYLLRWDLKPHGRAPAVS